VKCGEKHTILNFSIILSYTLSLKKSKAKCDKLAHRKFEECIANKNSVEKAIQKKIDTSTKNTKKFWETRHSRCSFAQMAVTRQKKCTVTI